jgi:L-ascorbate oxidase
VFGPLVVHEYDKDNIYKGQYDFDLPEHVIVLNDWLNQTSISKFAGHHHNDGNNKPDSILINGRGALHKFLDELNNTLRTSTASFHVNRGYKYRFRLINAGILYCPIEFSIDEHNLTVISSDGKLLDAYEVDSLVIYAGTHSQ